MNKSQLIDKVAESANVTKKIADATITATFEAIAVAVSSGEKVTLVGFGSFEPRQRKEREGRNPKTGEKMTIPATTVPGFSAGKVFKLMPVTYNRNFVEGKDIVPVDSRTLVYTSKMYDLFEANQEPEFGQVIRVTTAVTTGDTQIAVSSLIEPLPPGKELTFSSGTTVTTTIATEEGATTIRIVAATGDIAEGETATTTGIEQTITTTAAAGALDTSLTVAALDRWLEKDRIILFEPSGVNAVVTADVPVGATSIPVQPLIAGIGAGDAAELPNFELIYSLNSADDTTDSNVLTDRVFQSGPWTTKTVTSRSASISCAGLHIASDFGLRRIKRVGRQINKVIYFLIIEPQGGEQFKGWAHVGTSGNTRAVDSSKNISFTLEVDGELHDANYPLPTGI